MYLWLNSKFIKNIIICSCLCLATIVTFFIFHNVPSVFFITIILIFIFITYQFMQFYKSNENTSIKLVQSYLDKKLILKILNSIYLDPRFDQESLSMISCNILNYFFFYSIAIYKIEAESFDPVCISGDYDPKERRILLDFFAKEYKVNILTMPKDMHQIYAESDSVKKFKLFTIPLITNEYSGIITFKTHYNWDFSAQEVEFLKEICLIIQKLLTRKVQI